AELATYYREHPQLFTRDGTLVPFEQARADIVRTITQERRNTAIAGWVADLRRRADIIDLYSTRQDGPRTKDGRRTRDQGPGTSTDHEVLDDLHQIEPGVAHDRRDRGSAPQVHETPEGAEQPGRDRGIHPLELPVSCAERDARDDDAHRAAAEPHIEAV